MYGGSILGRRVFSLPVPVGKFGLLYGGSVVRGGNVFGFVDKTGSSNDKGSFGLMYGGLRGVVTLGTLGDTPGDTDRKSVV